MSNPMVSHAGTVRDHFGLPVRVGVDHDAVTVGDVTLGPAQQEEFTQLYVAACHQAQASAAQAVSG